MTIFSPTYPGPWANGRISQSVLSALAAGEPLSIPAEIECSQIVEWLNKHELAALAHLYLDRHDPAAMQLTHIYWANASANMMKLALLESLVPALAAAGIKCVLLKGIAFCLTIYPDTAVRPMSDLDLWIQRSDWPRTWQVLQDLGYERGKLWDKLWPIPDYITTAEFFPRRELAQDFFSIEIHSDLVAHPTHLIGRFPLTTWWERTQPQAWRGHTVYVLDPAAALLHTAVHQMFQHRGQLRLRWLLDVDQLVRGTASYHLSDDDWQRLGQEAAEAGVLPALQSILQISQKWFNTPLPEAALALLNQPSAPEQQIFFQKMVGPQHSTTAHIWADIQGMANIQQRLTLLYQKLLPNSDYMMERYQVPSRLLLPFYHIKRWGKAIRMLWRRE